MARRKIHQQITNSVAIAFNFIADQNKWYDTMIYSSLAFARSLSRQSKQIKPNKNEEEKK